MCGIIGYVGPRECKGLLLFGLERLEYRGYDSAGIALLEDGGLSYTRAVGNLQNLKAAAGVGDAGEAERAPPTPTRSNHREGEPGEQAKVRPDGQHAEYAEEGKGDKDAEGRDQRPERLDDGAVRHDFRQRLAEIHGLQCRRGIGRDLAVDLALQRPLDVGDLDR